MWAVTDTFDDFTMMMDDIRCELVKQFLHHDTRRFMSAEARKFFLLTTSLYIWPGLSGVTSSDVHGYSNT